MTPAELRSLALAAMPGPWEYSEIKGFPTVLLNNRKVDNPFFDLSCDNEAKFIAAANPQAILSLLDTLAQKDAEILCLREGLERYSRPNFMIFIDKPHLVAKEALARADAIRLGVKGGSVNWIILKIDETPYVQVCLRCGHRAPFPTGPLGYVEDLLKAFIKAHKRCKEITPTSDDKKE